MNREERETLRKLIDERQRELVTLPINPRCGTERSYRWRKCRCDLCKGVRNIKRRKRYQNRINHFRIQYKLKQRKRRAKLRENPILYAQYLAKQREYNKKRKHVKNRSERTVAGELRA